MNARLIELMHCSFTEQYWISLVQIHLRSKNGCISARPFRFVIKMLVCFEILQKWFWIDFDGSNIVADADTFRCGSWFGIKCSAAIYDHAVQAQCVKIHNFHQTDDRTAKAKSKNASECGWFSENKENVNLFLKFPAKSKFQQVNLNHTKQTIPCHVHIAAVFDACDVFEMNLQRCWVVQIFAVVAGNINFPNGRRFKMKMKNSAEAKFLELKKLQFWIK